MPADIHNLVTRKNIGSAKSLLQSLVPRAQCFCFYDLNKSCVWSSDGAEDYEIDNFIADLPRDILSGSDPVQMQFQYIENNIVISTSFCHI